MRDIGLQRPGMTSVKDSRKSGPYRNHVRAEGLLQGLLRVFGRKFGFVGHQICTHGMSF